VVLICLGGAGGYGPQQSSRKGTRCNINPGWGFGRKPRVQQGFAVGRREGQNLHFLCVPEGKRYLPSSSNNLKKDGDWVPEGTINGRGKIEILPNGNA